MCTSRRTVHRATVGLVLAGLTAGLATGAAQEKGEVVKPQPIPLDSVYVTSEQKGLKRVAVGQGNFDQPVLEDLARRSIKAGLSNVFLVRGAEIGDAVRATRLAFDSGLGASEPIPADRAQADKAVWLVAFFGVSGSSPPAWEVKGVERSGQRVRVSFAASPADSNDRHPYFAWVLLGAAEPGVYTLELFDVNVKEAVLSRRVAVKK
jgi:hypothetical protein